ncbi:DUF1799 domain-containing protein [Nitrosomonas aestuarii]
MFKRQGREGKLIEAARHWARRPARQTIDDDKLADPPEWQAAIEAHEESIQSGDDDDDGLFAVWPENWDAVVVFCNLRNCWRVDSMSGRYMGILRGEIRSTLQLMQIDEKDHATLFEKIMIMEDAALGVMNRK